MPNRRCLEIRESWGLLVGQWSLVASNLRGVERTIGTGERDDLLRRAKRLAMEEETIILVFNACRTVVEAYESIDCRQAVEDGLQARGVITEQGHVRHIVQPIDPSTLSL